MGFFSKKNEDIKSTGKHKFETRLGVILMDHVGNKSLKDIMEEGDMDKIKKYKTKARFMLIMLLWMGILHGDPHPENIRIDTETGKVYFIDFGSFTL